MDTLTPRDAAEVAEAVAGANAGEKRLDVIGHGTKRDIGRPAQSDATLDLSALTGVTLYEPEELVLSARAGTRLAEIEELLAGKGQEFAFEPMDYGPLLGGEPGRATIGGVFAANLSGPRRAGAGGGPARTPRRAGGGGPPPLTRAARGFRAAARFSAPRPPPLAAL